MNRTSKSQLAALMLMNADKFKDEAQHYACLQAAFAAAALDFLRLAIINS